ncbi:hypothetical protein H0H87_005521 [Tephrocybe sp. NHM501043]|nr:hypothetical protein H0H87_005521 [Tephrocybe sp. NHM501043]
MHNVPTILLEAYLIPILKYCLTKNVLLVFIIALFNIHHLTIVDITIASKFFSDVSYTILCYAKVGGLPLAKLNQLKLQFLLNNFCLIIFSMEMQHYAEQLVLFSSSADPHTQQNPHTHQICFCFCFCFHNHPPLPAPSKTGTETEAGMTNNKLMIWPGWEMEAGTEMTNNELTIQPGQGSMAGSIASALDRKGFEPHDGVEDVVCEPDLAKIQPFKRIFKWWVDIPSLSNALWEQAKLVVRANEEFQLAEVAEGVEYGTDQVV